MHRVYDPDRGWVPLTFNTPLEMLGFEDWAVRHTVAQRLSILHWRCWNPVLLPAHIWWKEGLLSILHWRCPGASIPPYVLPISFNTPLEMQNMDALAKAWRETRKFFQYSIGDAFRSILSCIRPPLRFLSILHWRCEVPAIVVDDPRIDVLLSILHWRCKSHNWMHYDESQFSFQYSIGDARRLTASTTETAMRVSFNTPLEMHWAPYLPWHVAVQPLSILHWRCVRRHLRRVAQFDSFQYSIGDAAPYTQK